MCLNAVFIVHHIVQFSVYMSCPSLVLIYNNMVMVLVKELRCVQFLTVVLQSWSGGTALGIKLGKGRAVCSVF